MSKGSEGETVMAFPRCSELGENEENCTTYQGLQIKWKPGGKEWKVGNVPPHQPDHHHQDIAGIEFLGRWALTSKLGGRGVWGASHKTYPN